MHQGLSFSDSEAVHLNCRESVWHRLFNDFLKTEIHSLVVVSTMAHRVQFTTYWLHWRISRIVPTRQSERSVSILLHGWSNPNVNLISVQRIEPNEQQQSHHTSTMHVTLYTHLISWILHETSTCQPFWQCNGNVFRCRHDLFTYRPCHRRDFCGSLKGLMRAALEDHYRVVGRESGVGMFQRMKVGKTPTLCKDQKCCLTIGPGSKWGTIQSKEGSRVVYWAHWPGNDSCPNGKE